MTAHNDIERRLEALEIKASFTEDLVDRLDQVIVRQQQTLDTLVAELLRLREQAASQAAGTGLRNLRDELPPHYYCSGPVKFKQRIEPDGPGSSS
jgi:SlyX protein